MVASGAHRAGSFRRGPFLRSLVRQRELWILCVPIIAWVGIFCYYPMYGLMMAFVDYVPGKEIWQCNFVGLKHITNFINKPIFSDLLRNTLAMSGLGITVGFVCPILFAFMLSEIGHLRTKKLVQTASYLPHFISWVVAGAMIKSILGADGVLNDMLRELGLSSAKIMFLQTPQWYWGIYTTANIWKGLGWSTIIYLSSMSGVDEELYQSGAIDGLNRAGMARHITFPTILPTIVLLWIMGIGGILSAGFEQHLIIGNSLTQNRWDVIDTYAYRFGVQQGYYSIGTAVSLLKSVVGFALVLITNAIARKVSDVALF